MPLKMVDTKYCLLWILFSLCYVSGNLNLEEGDACVTHGVNGTCVDVFKCPSASLIYLFNEFGYGNHSCPGRDCFPQMSDICSSEGIRPVVCCTDCNIGTSPFKNKFVGPMGKIIDKKGSVAKAKCYDFFKRLPYPCRGIGNIRLRKFWEEEKQCYTQELGVSLAVGGRDAKPWEFPHMALLGYGETVSSAQWLCGGTVISEKFVLTAAHCTYTHSLGSLKYAALGLLKRTDPLENWKVYNITRIINHPEYQSPSKYNDIALLELETEITFARDLLPACLDERTYTKFSAQASGWGRLGHRQSLADHLQVVSLTKFKESDCAEVYQPHRHLKQGYDNLTQMCFGSRTAVVDTCEGDSGGPLQTDNFRCLYTVVGVTSFGKNCGTLGSPGMYTRVSYYVPWIESIVWPGETNELE